MKLLEIEKKPSDKIPITLMDVITLINQWLSGEINIREFEDSLLKFKASKGK